MLSPAPIQHKRGPCRSSWPRVRDARSEASRSLRFCSSCASCPMAGGSDSGGCNAVFLSLRGMDEQNPETTNAAPRSTRRLEVPTQRFCNSPRKNPAAGGLSGGPARQAAPRGLSPSGSRCPGCCGPGRADRQTGLLPRHSLPPVPARYESLHLMSCKMMFEASWRSGTSRLTVRSQT